MIRVVFDTVIFVRCLINPYSYWGKLVFQYSDKYQMFVSQTTVAEILEVLHRPELTNKFKTLKNFDTATVIDILGKASSVEAFEISSASRDSKDDKFLAAALAADAQFLVTEDKDLLDLRQYQDTKIINAEAFIEILSGE